ncbi:DNA processing protein [Sporobacter termitidis DSM 10068]|uniref:DNA processing protein n=1 Tax=Sporobacter termitidis DSM 10068 TaxID=1123282 RepID=A0A1M5ULY2_9FIRM|nr:DNA-processing protein DprA [Sporobacter termitidis]SHH63733.1 DNA processing protein [Sporobacter termitidis DSM 10068]
MASLKYWVWLSTRPGVGAGAANRLLEWFGTPEQVFFADEKSYADIPSLRKNDLAALGDKNLLAAKKALEACEENGYRIVTLFDGDYPARLRNIPDPPVVLYVRGRLPVMDEEAAVAVVGTRSCTPYGTKAAERMGYELARHGCLVVSGLARGVDSCAALGALRAGGRVVGVIGSGLDIVYPPENGQLFEDVASTGAIISEYAPGTPVAGEHFPQRNRIMSGVSVGVAVIEAPLKSGALITASHALEQGRDVFALPGNVDSPACEGSNRLLREGAVPVMSGKDIAEEYEGLYPDKIQFGREKVPLGAQQAERLVAGVSARKRQKPAKKEIDNDNTVEYIDLVRLKERLSADEFRIISAIGPHARHIDEIIGESGLSAGAVLSALTMLELDGYVEQSKGKYFKLLYEINKVD